ncbi:MAG TPA: hypothetical protein VHD56_16410 [Tepidisphaeraceae bacterium]|nr:hypothetical protein [Tepidisphaeraceae bacterium]
MKRATNVYIIMLAVFALGIWVTLSVGSIFLHAPTDLSGRWQLKSATDPSITHDILIQQSGIYLRIYIDGDRNGYSLKLARDDKNTGIELQSDDDPKITITENSRPGVYNFHMIDPLPGDWMAVCTDRTYKPRTNHSISGPTTAHARI